VLRCVWTFLVANELVGVFTVLGVVFDVSDGIMGVTALAWGNSLGDLFGDVALAREVGGHLWPAREEGTCGPRGEENKPHSKLATSGM
jgi:hypothetical protein